MAQRLAGDAQAARDTFTRGRDFLLAATLGSSETQGYVHAISGQMYAGLADKTAALREVAAAIELEGDDNLLAPAAQETLARIEVQLGEKESALARLPQLLNAHYHSWFYFGPLTPALLRLDPTRDPLRGDSRFEKLAGSLAP